MDAKKLVTLPGQEPVWNISPGRRAALKLLNDQTGQSVMAFEEVAPPGTETSLHLHHDSDEVMYVLSGEFSFKVGDTVISGGPGTCVFMPRDVAHAWKNTGTETGRAFFIYTPGRAGKVFEESAGSGAAPPPASATPDPIGEELMRRHGWEIVGPPPF
jgi:mannose-6-phosphate isomerase-like protein (cupin superfamily)